MSIEQLIKLAPPPRNPVRKGTPELWRVAEDKLGTKFPSDYKLFLSVYGSCNFSEWMGIIDPFPTHDPCSNVFGRTELIRMGDEYEIHGFSEKKFTIPSKELVCFGGDANGNNLCWRKAGDSDSWPLLYFSLDGIEYNEYQLSLTEFLCGWLTGELVPECIGEMDILGDRGPFVISVEGV